MIFPTVLSPLLLATLSLARSSARAERPREALFEMRKPAVVQTSPQTGSQLPTITFQLDPQMAFSHPAPAKAVVLDVDHPVFGTPCDFVHNAPYLTCGDYLHLPTGVNHALFCSPRAGVCAGDGAACGSSEACDEGLSCNSFTQRCAKTGSFIISINAARLEQRRKTASGRCPERAEACPSGAGGFACAFTLMDTNECGGCVGLGGRDCSKIDNAFSSSCREGTCVVHACVNGFSPRGDGSGCEEIFENENEYVESP
ncbi:hypothetical protein RQP46_001072 [Phenoliferia psychrophenolica]